MVDSKFLWSSLRQVGSSNAQGEFYLTDLIEMAAKDSEVQTISVDQGPTARRFMPRAMGRASRINKKTSHVHVVLAQPQGK